jgi:hypothetical protein
MQHRHGAIETVFNGGRATGGEFYGADFFFGKHVLVIFLRKGDSRDKEKTPKQSDKRGSANTHSSLRKGQL